MKHVVVIGGGVAGMEASAKLSEMGVAVSIVEKADKLGGKLNRWDRLFPNSRPASDLLAKLQSGMGKDIRKYVNAEVSSVRQSLKQFDIALSNGEDFKADAILISTGFDVFDAHRKEEYGYGIYDNVITSADLEKTFRKGETLKTASGKKPQRVGIIHCVGSRDEKAGNNYCSKVCCITAVKQAIEIKEQNPEAEVFCFYMDLRMYDRHFETIYKEAQVKHGIQFIRGRLSEAFENADGSVMLKAEDTLLGKPLKINVDMVVLMAGMVPSSGNRVKEQLNLTVAEDGFFNVADAHYESSGTNVPGVFVAGACTGPKTMENTINEARSAALAIKEYLR
ncbi:MAG: FAD-dependent oxidoreductase [Bacteroidota bacterium]|nr:FAD-dependent oxidoreductase [Bacteroidota bacterium]